MATYYETLTSAGDLQFTVWVRNDRDGHVFPIAHNSAEEARATVNYLAANEPHQTVVDRPKGK